MTPISKPYAHGLGRWRCKARTLTGWRWCASASTPEEAQRIAQAGKEPALDHEDQDPNHRNQEREIPPQPRAQPGGVRIQGPYRHAEAWRCRIVTSAGRTWAQTAATETEAMRCAEKQAETTARQGNMSIRDSIEAYVRGKQTAGARPATIAGARRALTLFFTGILSIPIGRLTPRRCQDLYDALQVWLDPRSGEALSVATHRSYLQHGRSWGRWVVSKGWMRGPSPLDAVHGVGRKKRGKPQLSLDEAKRFYGCALESARQGDEGAVAVLMAISMGMRASEILSRTPRDLDDGGKLLRIGDNLALDFKTKNESSNRPVAVPTDLQPILADMARDKMQTDPIFPGEGRTGRRPRQWLGVQVARLCERAKVPIVCPHSLRGVSATAAAAAGALPELVAQMLGHTSSTMTKGHYIKAGTSEAVQLERGLLVLTGQPASPASLPS